MITAYSSCLHVLLPTVFAVHVMSDICRSTILNKMTFDQDTEQAGSDLHDLNQFHSFSNDHCWRLYCSSHTHTRLTALFPGLPRWAGTRRVKPIWILVKQETVSGSGISWAICKSAPRSRQITTPVPHYTAVHWRKIVFGYAWQTHQLKSSKK